MPCHQAVGRAGARFDPHLLPPRRRAHGGFLRDAGRQREALRGPCASERWRRASRRSSRWPCPPTMPIEGSQAGASRGSVRRGDARRGRRRIDIMVDCHARPSPAMGMQFAQALEPYGLYFLEEPCWPECVAGLAAINAAVSTPIATGERVTHLAAVSRSVRGAGLRSLPARHHALRRLHAKRGASPHWRMRIAFRSHRTIRKVRSARRHRSSSASRSRATSSARRSPTMCRGGRTWSRRIHGRARRPHGATRTTARSRRSK